MSIVTLRRRGHDIDETRVFQAPDTPCGVTIAHYCPCTLPTLNSTYPPGATMEEQLAVLKEVLDVPTLHVSDRAPLASHTCPTCGAITTMALTEFPTDDGA